MKSVRARRIGPVARVKPRAARPSAGDVLDFLGLIWAVDHALHRISKRMEATVGVTGPQRLVIRLVGRFPGISAGRLSELLRLHPSTVTGILTRLEHRGLLERRRDPTDRRRLRLGLTARGRQFDVPSQGTIEAAVARALGTLPGSTLPPARAALAAIARMLDAERAEKRVKGQASADKSPEISTMCWDHFPADLDSA
jgi:DNA-binding MarR family transcriptional regulator